MEEIELTEDLKKCVEFHGHLCPGLTYGYLVACEARRLLSLTRSQDEEVVAFPENDSCAIDALQVILGTTAGKGNLILRDYGKNAYTIYSRTQGRAFRFTRKTEYRYEGEDRETYAALDKKVADKRATEEEKRRLQMMKVRDLLKKNFSALFETQEVEPPKQPYAPLAPSVACSLCGEMTMSTKLLEVDKGVRYCIPCAQKKGIPISFRRPQ